MSWDRRIRDDELVVRPRQPCHVESPYLVSKPAIKLWVAVDTKDRPFLFIACAYVMKPLRYDPPLVSLISQPRRLPAANHSTLKTARVPPKSPYWGESTGIRHKICRAERAGLDLPGRQTASMQWPCSAHWLARARLRQKLSALCPKALTPLLPDYLSEKSNFGDVKVHKT